MKVFISADIEGTCGITDWAETERCTMDDYKPFQKQMTREVKAACKGALDAGVGEIFLKDAHDSARNIDAAELPECIRILRGWTGDPLSMMSGLDRDDYGAVLFTGYHAWASCPGNPLSHTMNLRNEHVLLNGVRASEFLINAYTAGYYGVPAVFLSGDEELCAFAREFIPEIVTVPVNRGVGGGVISTPTWPWNASGREPRRRCIGPPSARCPCRSGSTARSDSGSTGRPTPRAFTPGRGWKMERVCASPPTTGMRCCGSTTSCSVTAEEGGYGAVKRPEPAPGGAH